MLQQHHRQQDDEHQWQQQQQGEDRQQQLQNQPKQRSMALQEQQALCVVMEAGQRSDPNKGTLADPQYRQIKYQEGLIPFQFRALGMKTPKQGQMFVAWSRNGAAWRYCTIRGDRPW